MASQVPHILHVDMDAFFVAVEVLRDRTLAGRPVVVGGTGDRGVVASCSYEARARGVHSAMPTWRARRLCPDAVFLPGRFDDYQEVSRRLHRIFTAFTPLVEGVALDEAFLDVSGARRLLGEAPTVARDLRARVSDELHLDCSVGVARTKMLAKLASRAAKPTPSPRGARPGPGVVVVEPERELQFLHPMPVSALWGVGPATQTRLTRLGVTTVGDLARLPPASLAAAVGRAAARHLHDLAWARGGEPVVASRPAKSVGHEETFATDRRDPRALQLEVVRLAEAVAGRLRRAGTAGRTVTVKVRFADFSTVTRSRRLPTAVDTAPELARVAAGLLELVDVSTGVRLLGVSVSGLGAPSEVEQLSLDAPEGDGWRAVGDAIETLRSRFGDKVVGPASLATAGDKGPVGANRWGPDASRC